MQAPSPPPSTSPSTSSSPSTPTPSSLRCCRNCCRQTRRHLCPSQRQPGDSPPNPTIWALRPSHATADAGNDPTILVQSMVAVCLLKREPLTPIESATMLWKEKATLLELSGEADTITVVEAAPRAIAADTAPGQPEDTSAVKLEDYGVRRKARVLLLEINRSRLVKELKESRSGSTALGSDGMRRPMQTTTSCPFALIISSGTGSDSGRYSFPQLFLPDVIVKATTLLFIFPLPLPPFPLFYSFILLDSLINSLNFA